MSRIARTLFAYRMIVPDEQFDLFACRENRLHLVARQLELNGHVDRTLCDGLLPARPLWRDLPADILKDPRLCPLCRKALQARRQGLPSAVSYW
ncbi:hypothetical protein [Stutzerimonas kirkiae]|uniref:Uncharacterized protein n=1 Tax=Stutzerimonas kirkiae TaxID=2211392 RepID=A0A4Q9QZE3_9GAMM|nr:hypothetical protein [Stutzerimonas kirkiae]TBU91299.1 hypothetical protein DNJ96_16180 [Stutzerimonas kirkiae]TBV00431.1 hypothetical protein DNJ95_14840 [Stutzerimonas kirkiae]TBV11797.1 hypothetical protein DNK08_02440 [Stutzerimonas kirkiae]TBV15277.1 hypothetical protein DNK01_06245 [Stutzerimonas kirkiae]